MKINVCGFTASQNNTILSNKKGIKNFSVVLPLILKDLGYDVKIGDYSGYSDLNFVFIYTLNSLNTSYVLKSLELLKNNKNCIICFDDWNVKLVYKDNQSIIDGKKTFLTHPHYHQSQIKNYINVLNRINVGYYKVLFPAFKKGNHDLINIVGQKHYIDPSIYCDYKLQHNIFDKKIKKWIYAGLCDKTPWLSRQQFKWKKIIIDDLTESDILNLFNQYYGILCPPHYHVGSGWWRNRYVMANEAKSILVGDPEENKLLFGNSYDVDIKQVENINTGELNDLIERQNIDYQKSIMTKKEIEINIKKLL